MAGPITAHAPMHVSDVVPTILDVTGVAPVTELGGEPVQTPEGESFFDLLLGQDWSREQPIFFEHEGNAAIRAGQFKLVRVHGCDWELYDMEADRTELSDLAGRNRPLEMDLKGQYVSWADKAGVLEWEVALPRLLKAWDMESAEG